MQAPRSAAEGGGAKRLARGDLRSHDRIPVLLEVSTKRPAAVDHRNAERFELFLPPGSERLVEDGASLGKRKRHRGFSLKGDAGHSRIAHGRAESNCA